MSSTRAVILVEGTSDQAAIDALARRHGRDLASEGTAIVAMGGAHGVARYLVRFGPRGDGLAVAGLCDAGEEAHFRRGLVTAGIGAPQTRAEMEDLGFYVCVADLEDELIRACGQQTIEAVLDEAGDLTSFRTLQKQPAWRDEPFDAQMRRFLGAGARRKRRYAELLVDALPLGLVPRPLVSVLSRVR